MKKQTMKSVSINGLKFYKFENILKRDLKSKKFRVAYEEELARLKLAQQIKTMRLRQKLTQKQTAQKAKMPQSVIARIESGTHSYSLGTLSRIAQVFHKEIQLV